MVLSQIQELIPLIAGNLLIILASSFFGSLFILLGRSIRQKRALISALHAELVDNHTEAMATRSELETRESDLFGAFTNLQVRSSAIKSLQTNDPSLYASIDAYSDNLYKPYIAHPQFEEYEKIGFWKMMLETISITKEAIPDGGEPIDPDPLKKTVKNYEGWTQEAIVDVESYTEEGILRQIVYYNCLPQWSVEEVE